MSIDHIRQSHRLNDVLHSRYRRTYHRASESTTSVLAPVVVITVSHWYDFDTKTFSTCGYIGDALQKLISC